MRERAWSKTWLPARIWLQQEIDWQTGELTAPESFALEIASRLVTDQALIEDQWMRLRPVSLDEWRWLTARHALRNGNRQTRFIYD